MLLGCAPINVLPLDQPLRLRRTVHPELISERRIPVGSRCPPHCSHCRRAVPTVRLFGNLGSLASAQVAPLAMRRDEGAFDMNGRDGQQTADRGNVSSRGAGQLGANSPIPNFPTINFTHHVLRPMARTLIVTATYPAEQRTVGWLVLSAAF